VVKTLDGDSYGQIKSKNEKPENQKTKKPKSSADLGLGPYRRGLRGDLGWGGPVS
jgi:hypothetical protein